jgi:hypothetical protein
MQHYHTSTNLSLKLDASLRYLQLQLGTLHNPLLLDYAKWEHLTPLSWVKMLWRSLHYFNIHLHMAYPTNAFPWERDQVIMEIFHSEDLSPELIRGLGRCPVLLEAIFLLDITTTGGQYLEHFIFEPGGRDKASTFKFPCKWLTQSNWNSWFNFLNNFTTTRDKLKAPLGNWIRQTHHISKWYYRVDDNVLQWVEGNTIFYYKPPFGFCLTSATRRYHLMREEPLLSLAIHGIPTSVTGLSNQQVVKLSEGPVLATDPDDNLGF